MNFYGYEFARESDLTHHGILGQKWGVRRFQNLDGSYTTAGAKRRYHSTSLSSIIARKQNQKVDKSFDNWKDNVAKRDFAIQKGKEASSKRMEYERDPKNKQLKKEYKTLNKEYKEALRENTAYRKGTVRAEVGKDLSRQYLSEAKKIEKQLKSDPNNRELQKQYDHYMSKHDVERAKARRAQDVGANRSRRIATMKRGATMAVKAAVTTAAVSIGIAAVNKYAMDGKLNISSDQVIRYANMARNALRYIY